MRNPNLCVKLFSADSMVTYFRHHILKFPLKGLCMKKLLVVLAFAIPMLNADWLDDMVILFAEQKDFDVKKATPIIQKYIEQDKKEIESLEKQAQDNNQSGFWAGLRGGTYRAQLFAARSSLKSHEKVASFVTGLPENKKDREEFMSNCKVLNDLNQELASLQKEFDEEKRYTTKKVKLGALIAAKTMHIQTKKTLMKTFSI